MIHDLKILPEYFVEVVRGNKTFEVRKDDRPFNVGDELILYEVNCGKYTGRNIKVIITYILRNPDYCKEGYCILGFKPPVKRGRWITKAENYYKAWQDSGRSWDDMPYFVTGLKFACSNCFEQFDVNAEGVEKWNGCPLCLARMDGEQNE